MFNRHRRKSSIRCASARNKRGSALKLILLPGEIAGGTGFIVAVAAMRRMANPIRDPCSQDQRQ